MDKIAAAQLLTNASGTLRAQNAKIADLEQKVAQYERLGRVQKLASEMEQKRLNPELTYEEKCEQLMSRQDLDVVEKAVALSAPQGMKLASVDDDRLGNSSDSRAELLRVLSE